MIYGEYVYMTDEPLNERRIDMWSSKYVAMKDHDVCTAYDVSVCYKGRLSIIYDRIIETQKGMERISIQSKNDKLINPC